MTENQIEVTAEMESLAHKKSRIILERIAQLAKKNKWSGNHFSKNDEHYLGQLCEVAFRELLLLNKITFVWSQENKSNISDLGIDGGIDFTINDLTIDIKHTDKTKRAFLVNEFEISEQRRKRNDPFWCVDYFGAVYLYPGKPVIAEFVSGIIGKEALAYEVWQNIPDPAYAVPHSEMPLKGLQEFLRAIL